MTMGDRIKMRRLELNMSQDELAKKVGYKSRSSINKIESSRALPSRKVEKMAAALDCSPAFIMGWESGHKEMILRRPPAKKTNTVMVLSKKTLTHSKILEAYQKASPDTQSAVRAILHISDSD